MLMKFRLTFRRTRVSDEIQADIQRQHDDLVHASMAPNAAGAPEDLLPSMAPSLAPVLRAAEDALCDLNQQLALQKLWASKAAWSPQRTALTKALKKAGADAFGWRRCMLAYEAKLHSTWGPQLYGLLDTDRVALSRSYAQWTVRVADCSTTQSLGCQCVERRQASRAPGAAWAQDASRAPGLHEPEHRQHVARGIDRYKIIMYIYIYIYVYIYIYTYTH